MNSAFDPQVRCLRQELNDLDVNLYVWCRPASTPEEAERARHNAEVLAESMLATLQGIREALTVKHEGGAS